MNHTNQLPEKSQFFQAYADAWGIDFDTNAVYVEMLKTTKAHLEAELEKIKPGCAFSENPTRVTIASDITDESVFLAHRVAHELRRAGYQVEVGGYAGYGELWLNIWLI